ncbi:hypothetical protein ACLOJK_003254 [Asimina triloba]
MAIGHRSFSSLFILLLLGQSTALISSESSHAANPSSPKAISDLKDAIVNRLGFQSDDLKISGFDFRDALVGQSVVFEFDIQVGKKVLPFKLLEDVSKWEYVDLPIFQTDKSTTIEGEDSTGLAERITDKGQVLPVLAPFQLAGPMELWIQDADNVRLALPHDVDAGVLKKVVLADGAVVTVKGARSVSLHHPLDLPLPLNRTASSKGRFASGLLTLAEYLRLSSLSEQENKPLLSLRIVGPTSLTASDNNDNSKLKLRRLAPGLVELSSRSKPHIEDNLPVLTPKRFTTLWPLPSINGSNANLQGFEELLASVLGEKAYQEGSFRLLKATVSAQTSVKIGFEVEKDMVGGEMDWSHFPEWRTRPKKARMHFEVVGKLEGDKLVPETVMPVEDPVELEDTFQESMLTGNVSMSSVPVVRPPPNHFTLEIGVGLRKKREEKEGCKRRAAPPQFLLLKLDRCRQPKQIQYIDVVTSFQSIRHFTLEEARHLKFPTSYEQLHAFVHVPRTKIPETGHGRAEFPGIMERA